MYRRTLVCGFLFITFPFFGCDSKRTDTSLSDLPQSEPLPADRGSDGGLVRTGRSADQIEPEVVGSLSSALSEGDLKILTDGANWTEDIKPAPALGLFKPVSIPCLKGRITGIAVSPSSHRAAVTVGEAAAGSKPWTQIFWCDTAAGALLGEWKLSDHYEALDLSADGRLMLCRRVDPRAREILTLCAITEDGKLKSRSWQPHEATLSPIGSASDAAAKNSNCDVAWAGFAGSGRVITASRGGQLRIWDASRWDRIERLANCEALPVHPTITPDKTHILFLTTSGLALLEPNEGKILGVKPFPAPSDGSGLAVSPDGKSIACWEADRVHIMDLKSGQTHSITLWHPAHDKPEATTWGWAGDRHLLIGNSLYDTQISAPVWTYSGSVKIAFSSRTTWVCSATRDGKSELGGYAIPQLGVKQKLEETLKDPRIYALKKGDSIRIDVSPLPADKQDEVRLELESSLAKLGFSQGREGDAILQASVEACGVKKEATYSSGHGFIYTERFARLKLVKDGKMLWEIRATTPAPARLTFNVKKGDGQIKSPAEIATEMGVGSPAYAIFRGISLPSHFAGKGFPSNGFGQTVFGGDGLDTMRSSANDDAGAANRKAP